MRKLPVFYVKTHKKSFWGGGKMPSEALKFQRLPCCVRGKFRI